MKHHTLLLAALLAAAGAATAQKASPMKPADVTESAITEALAPPAAPEAASSEPRTRGFAPSLRPPAAKKTGSAAVLITFVTDSAQLTGESQRALDTIARALRGGQLANLNFIVEGHADPRGGAGHNLELSRARAESVVAYLVKEHGIERQRLQPVGKGAAEPLNREQPAAPENRRVTFITQTN